MNEHLTSAQIANCLIGETNPAEGRHLRECASCRAELEDLQNAFSLYRDAGRTWSEHWIAKADFKPRRVRAGRMGKWALAGGLAVAVLAGVLFLRAPSLPVRSDEPFFSIPFVVPPAA